ncbi:hypothetical protein GP939_32175 [Escherichia coli]|nr:hypothetical protein [Escherichia coli]
MSEALKVLNNIRTLRAQARETDLETLEEIAVQNKEFFMEAGGTKYEYIPALNDSPEHIDMMVSLVTTRR